MPDFTVENLPPDRFAEWNEYVLDHPVGAIFHTTWWLSRIRPEVEVVVARSARGNIQGGMALVRTRRFGVSGYHKPEFTTYFGPLFTGSGKSRDAGARTEELALVQSLLKALPRAPHYDFMLPPGPVDALPYLWNGFQPSVHYSYVLSGTYDQYLAGMVKRKRRNVRQAWEEVEAGRMRLRTDGRLVDMLGLLDQARDVTGLAVSAGQLQRLLSFDPDRKWWRLFLVTDETDKPLAGAIVLVTRRRTCGFISAVANDLRDNQTLANLLAYDAAIKESLEAGRAFDFCGSSLPGIERFLRYFGGEFMVRYRFQKSRSPLMFLIRAANQFRLERRPFQIRE